MNEYEKLMKALALMAALKDLVDPSDHSDLREPLNKAWDAVRKDAADAATAWVKSRGTP